MTTMTTISPQDVRRGDIIRLGRAEGQRTMRIVNLSTVALALALALAACGGGGEPDQTDDVAEWNAQVAAWDQCLEEHGGQDIDCPEPDYEGLGRRVFGTDTETEPG